LLLVMNWIVNRSAKAWLHPVLSCRYPVSARLN
jgi:hypothetical protein